MTSVLSIKVGSIKWFVSARAEPNGIIALIRESITNAKAAIVCD